MSVVPRHLLNQSETHRCRRSAARAAIIALGLFAAVSRPARAEVFRCQSGDVPCLISAINVANTNGEKNTIRLASGTYSLIGVDNNTDGANGLPSIASTLRIEGV